jgi:flagellar biogenesis protein FliO
MMQFVKPAQASFDWSAMSSMMMMMLQMVLMLVFVMLPIQLLPRLLEAVKF